MSWFETNRVNLFLIDTTKRQWCILPIMPTHLTDCGVFGGPWGTILCILCILCRRDSVPSSLPPSAATTWPPSLCSTPPLRMLSWLLQLATTALPVLCPAPPCPACGPPLPLLLLPLAGPAAPALLCPVLPPLLPEQSGGLYSGFSSTIIWVHITPPTLLPCCTISNSI